MALPLSFPPAETADAAAAGIRPRILVVDDHEATCEILIHILRREFDVVTLHDGTSAWERMQNETDFAAVITDLGMPGLDGIELLHRIRGCKDARIQSLPVIAITGSDDKDTRRRAFVAGVTGFINKPLDMAQLLALVHAYVRHEMPARKDEPPAEPHTPVNPSGGGSNTHDPLPGTEHGSAAAQSGEDEQTHIQPDHARMPTDDPVHGSTRGDAIPTRTEHPIPALKPTSEAPAPPPLDSFEALSVTELEALIEKEISVQATSTEESVSPTGISNQSPLPVALVSIDQALYLLAHGRSAELIPYLGELRERLEPLLQYYHEHGGKDIAG